MQQLTIELEFAMVSIDSTLSKRIVYRPLPTSENLTACEFPTLRKILLESFLRIINLTDFLKATSHKSSEHQFKTLSYIQVEDISQDLKRTNGKDAYDLNIKLLFSFRHKIIIPLTSLFNLCIEQDTFPVILKGSIVPSHKKDSLDDRTNYRPISIIPCFAKIFADH